MDAALHLPGLVSRIERAARAWRTVSTEGAPRCVSLANVVVTMSEHALPTAPAAAPGQLGALNAQGTEALEWLRDAVARLARILRGVDESIDALATVPGDGPLVWRLSAQQWGELATPVAEGMHRDLADKRKVLALLEKAADAAGFDREELELAAATWLEQPRLQEFVAEKLAAALDAETEARRVQDLAGDADEPMDEAPQTDREDVSPALAMLLGK